MRSPDSARCTASMETCRLTESGETASGSTTLPRSGMTGSSAGSCGVRDVLLDTGAATNSV